MSSIYPIYETETFKDIFPDYQTFHSKLQDNPLFTNVTINDAFVYYLLYGRYANSPIANLDTTQFEYKFFGILWQYYPTWQKRLNVQEALRDLSLNDLIDNGKIEDLFQHSGTNGNTRSGSVVVDQDTTDTNTTTGESETNTTGHSETDNTGTVGNSGSDTYNNYKTANTGKDIENTALNPEALPTTGTTEELDYINSQKVTKYGKDTTVSGSISHNNTQTNNLHDETDTTGNETSESTATSNGSGTLDSTTTTSITDSGTDTSNDSNTKTLTRGKLEGYEKLLALLETDVTTEFLNKFKICFKQFVAPERRILYYFEED